MARGVARGAEADKVAEGVGFLVSIGAEVAKRDKVVNVKSLTKFFGANTTVRADFITGTGGLPLASPVGSVVVATVFVERVVQADKVDLAPLVATGQVAEMVLIGEEVRGAPAERLPAPVARYFNLAVFGAVGSAAFFGAPPPKTLWVTEGSLVSLEFPGIAVDWLAAVSTDCLDQPTAFLPGIVALSTTKGVSRTS